jgi:hypothetical protein
MTRPTSTVAETTFDLLEREERRGDLASSPERATVIKSLRQLARRAKAKAVKVTRIKF